MEGQPSGSLREHQDLVTKLTGMLQGVDLPENSKVHEQCIYRVPPKIRQGNPKAYTPQVISIGPFHKPHGSGKDNILESMEELKVKYLKGFLARTELSVGDFFLKLKEWETRIRSCYAEPIKYDSDDFLKMILIDACFIIEHFLRYFEYQIWEKMDPILLKSWLQNDFDLDLMLLENQLPFFVLEDIYNLAGVNLEFTSFLDVAFNYFQQHNTQEINPINLQGRRPEHFTDLLRTFWLPSPITDRGTNEGEGAIVNHLYSASQLLEAGLVFKVSESKCLLDLKFCEGGVLTMPRFNVHDTTEIYIRNIVAFEECHYPHSSLIAGYLKTLDFFINTKQDVNILVDKKIIVNWMGDANAVATMINNLSSNIAMPCLNSDYCSLYKDLNSFYENPRNKYKAIFIREYFNTPWKIASTSAAVMLLFLTLIQTICSVISLCLR